MPCAGPDVRYRKATSQGKVIQVPKRPVCQEATKDLHKRRRTACCPNQVAGICQAATLQGVMGCCRLPLAMLSRDRPAYAFWEAQSDIRGEASNVAADKGRCRGSRCCKW